MSINLLDLVKNYVTGEVVEKAAGFLGENKENTQNALSGIFPTLLNAVASKGGSMDGANAIFSLLNQGNHDGSILNNLGSLFGGGERSQGIMNAGTGILSSLFGNKVGSVVDMIASFSGLKRNSSSSLLNMAAPVLMGLLGKQVKDNGLSVSGLMNLLGGQSGFIKQAMPSGLNSLFNQFGLNDLTGAVKSTVSNTVSTAKEVGSKTVSTATTTAKAVADEGGSFFSKILPWLGLALLALGALWYFRGCGKDVSNAVDTTTSVVTDATNSAVDATTKAVDATVDAAKDAGTAVAEGANSAWASLGKLFSFKLPNGVELNIPELGVEKRFVDYIASKEAIDKKKWFSLDRLLFETGKATLKPESQEQLKNLAEILKAYPAVKLKAGGYTDNQGDDKANMQLSNDRASNVVAELVKLGVDKARLSSEGYGEQHPVCPANDTEECRAKNRRIDFNVTAK